MKGLISLPVPAILHRRRPAAVVREVAHAHEGGRNHQKPAPFAVMAACVAFPQHAGSKSLSPGPHENSIVRLLPV
jgi:hypothetical protein